MSSLLVIQVYRNEIVFHNIIHLYRYIHKITDALICRLGPTDYEGSLCQETENQGHRRERFRVSAHGAFADLSYHWRCTSAQTHTMLLRRL